MAQKREISLLDPATQGLVMGPAQYTLIRIPDEGMSIYQESLSGEIVLKAGQKTRYQDWGVFLSNLPPHIPREGWFVN